MAIIWRGPKTVRVKDIILPGDFRSRLNEERIVELAVSFAGSGGRSLHRVIVEAGTMRVVAGLDRMAAHVMRKDRHVEVELVEGDGDSLEVLGVYENLYRRADNRDELRRRAVSLLTAQPDGVPAAPVVEPAGAPRPGGKRGRPVGSRGKARRAVAEATGATPAAIAAADNRAASVGRAAVPSEPIEEATEALVDLLGVSAPLTLIDEIIQVQEAIDVAANHLRLALGAIKRLEDGPYAGAHYQAMYGAIRAAGYQVRSRRPTMICPWCKLVEQARERCGGCHGRGYVFDLAHDSIPPELLVVGAGAVYAVDGQFVAMPRTEAE